MTQSIYIPRGVNTEALSRSIMWDYQPEGFKVHFLFSLFETNIRTSISSRLFVGAYMYRIQFSNQNIHLLLGKLYSKVYLYQPPTGSYYRLATHFDYTAVHTVHEDRTLIQDWIKAGHNNSHYHSIVFIFVSIHLFIHQLSLREACHKKQNANIKYIDKLAKFGLVLCKAKHVFSHCPRSFIPTNELQRAIKY